MSGTVCDDGRDRAEDKKKSDEQFVPLHELGLIIKWARSAEQFIATSASTRALQSGLRRPPQTLERTHPERMAHAPRDAERVIEKAFLVRFFADGGFRVEGPFPPLQVQRLIDTNECQAWLRDPALIAIWGMEPIAYISEREQLAPAINEIASRLAHKRYQPLKANHYRAQHARHWQAEKGHTP